MLDRSHHEMRSSVFGGKCGSKNRLIERFRSTRCKGDRAGLDTESVCDLPTRLAYSLCSMTPHSMGTGGVSEVLPEEGLHCGQNLRFYWARCIVVEIDHST
jgi:hypothetical protein